MNTREAADFMGLNPDADLSWWVRTRCDNAGLMGPAAGGSFL